jgi:hypothetical protein
MPKDFRIRQARMTDLGSILQFYAKNRRQYLPPPSVKDIAETIGLHRIILLEARDTGQILASGAIFRYSPANSKTYIGELAGMLATEPVNGLRPVNAQTLILGARLLGHAATEAEPGSGRTNSLITIVHKDNRKSITNIEGAGFLPLPNVPGWFKYEELAWHGSIIKDQWRYYYATSETILRTAKALAEHGLFDGQFNLNRIDRASGQVEQCTIHSELTDIMNAADDLKALLRQEYEINLCSPPATLVF